MKNYLGFVSVLIALTAVAPAAEPNPAWGGDPIAPINAPFAMPQLERPKFSSRVFNLLEYGAVGDGITKNTHAFGRAIAACSAAGGGRVLVPAGKWFTGPIHFKSNVELHVSEGAEIIFSDRFEDYLPVVLVRGGGIEFYNYSPLIYARDCENVAITGPGKLNGNAKAWWPWKTKETKEIFQLAPKGVPVEKRIFGTPEAAIRPSFVVFFNCRNVLMEGFTIGGGPNWTIHPIYCENTIIRRVHVLTEGPNNDGIDPDSCRNVLIEHCVFDTGDDCVVLKSGYNEDGWRVARPTENVVMRWCFSKRGHGGLVIGSEMSGDVRNVYMHDCRFEGTDHALRVKSRADRGGVVENVWAEKLEVRDMKYDVVILTMDYGADRNAPVSKHPPVFRNFHVREVTGNGAPLAIQIQGMAASPVENVTFENMTIASTRGVSVSEAKGLAFKNVTITPKTGPAFELTNAANVTFSSVNSPAEKFLSVVGTSSRDIRIESADPAKTKNAITLAPEVSADAVSVR